jgi:hypothetical protein
VYHRPMICTSQKWVLCCGMNYSPVGDNCCSLQHLKYFNVLRERYGVQCHFQQYFSYIVAVCFIWGGNRSTRKNTDLPQVTDKFYHKMLNRVNLVMSGWINLACYIRDMHNFQQYVISIRKLLFGRMQFFEPPFAFFFFKGM